MLTEKDYCDYETCVALKELGFKVPTSAYYMPKNNQLIFVSNPFRGGYIIDCFNSHNSLREDIMTHDFIDAPTMWEAQKWLREEKFLLIVVDRLLNGEYVFSIVDILNYSQEKDGTANSFEEALSEGIKEAVKILKDNETILR